MKYNRTLDFMVLSMNAMQHGKTELAAKLFAKANTQGDVEDAIRILEASNAKSYEVEAAAKKVALEAAAKAKKEVKVVAKKAPAPAAKRLQASDEFGEDAPEGTNDGVVDESELGADLVEDDDLEMDDEPEEQLSGDLSELEDVAEEEEEVAEEPVVEDDVASQFAAVLASMQKRSTKK